MLKNLPLSSGLRQGINALELSEATDVQNEVIPVVLSGEDVLVSAKTGSGKTLAYLIPTAQRVLDGEHSPDTGTLVLILVPTRELARQVEKNFIALAKNTGLKSGVIIGGSDFRYQKSIFRKNPEFIIATPGRLIELIKIGSADLESLQTLVIDEADRMLDMGFKDDVLEIIAASNVDRQTLLLSATLRHTGVTRIAGEVLKDAKEITVGSERSQHSNIHQQVVLVDNKTHKEKLLAHLLQSARVFPKQASHAPEPDGDALLAEVADKSKPASTKVYKTLVFSNTRKQADQLSAYLSYHKLRAGSLHGELTQEERNHVVTLFSEGKINVLVASDVAARGLDVKDIDTVINFDFPRSVDDYIHRIGRTGRAGQQGMAISFVSANDWNLMVSIERYTDSSFERRVVKGLRAKFSGPKKVKSNGKAAGPKKKKTKSDDKSASRHRNTKNKGKRKVKRYEGDATSEDKGQTDNKPLSNNQPQEKNKPSVKNKAYAKKLPPNDGTSPLKKKRPW